MENPYLIGYISYTVWVRYYLLQ